MEMPPDIREKRATNKINRRFGKNIYSTLSVHDAVVILPPFSLVDLLDFSFSAPVLEELSFFVLVSELSFFESADAIVVAAKDAMIEAREIVLASFIAKCSLNFWVRVCHFWHTCDGC
jgi:hypothetical protein